MGVPAYGLATSPDGERLLVGGMPSPPRTAPMILSLKGGEHTNLYGFAGQVWGVAFSPDGRLAAAAGGILFLGIGLSGSGTQRRETKSPSWMWGTRLST